MSRQGVQRDILPILEGSMIQTKYGTVNTEHMLFIGAGAFHVSKPSDLIPELQGRFPIRVELESLSVEDFVKLQNQNYRLSNNMKHCFKLKKLQLTSQKMPFKD